MWSAAEIRAKLYIRRAISARLAQPDDRRHVDAVDQLLGLVAVEHRGPAFFDHVLRPAHRGGGVLFDDLPDDQPVEQHAQCREVLLDGRSSIPARQGLNIGRDVMRADGVERADAVPVEAGEEAAHRDAIGGPGVRVADVGSEEIDKAPRRALAGGAYQRRYKHRPGRRNDDRDRGRRCGRTIWLV
jgi:hypothetical protein